MLLQWKETQLKRDTIIKFNINKIGKVYPLKCTNIPKVFFMLHHVGHCYTNAIRGHCLATMSLGRCCTNVIWGHCCNQPLFPLLCNMFQQWDHGSHCCTTMILVMSNAYLLGKTRQTDVFFLFIARVWRTPKHEDYIFRNLTLPPLTSRL
jgi:hypothetical protein